MGGGVCHEKGFDGKAEICIITSEIGSIGASQNKKRNQKKMRLSLRVVPSFSFCFC